MVAPAEVKEQQDQESTLPSEFRFIADKIELVNVVHELLRLGEQVIQVMGTPDYESVRQGFEAQLDEAINTPRIEFLLKTERHPTLDVNLMGFIRHYIGEAVGGKKEVPLRRVGRGVSDKSGKK